MGKESDGRTRTRHTVILKQHPITAHNVYYDKFDSSRRVAGTGKTPTSTYGIPVYHLAALTGVHIDTARRWKRTGFVDGGYGTVIARRTSGDLGFMCDDWRGWKLRGKQLYTPDGWPIRPGEILALPYRYQQIRTYEQMFRQGATEVQL